MKKLINLTIASGIALALAGCGSQPTPKKVASNPIMELDVAKVCDVKANGLDKVLATAKKYNPIAVKKEIEFMRFKISNSKAISEIEKARKAGKTTVALMKKKKYALYTVDEAANRACIFAIRPLQQEVEAEESWREAVPGDGFKY